MSFRTSCTSASSILSRTFVREARIPARGFSLTETTISIVLVSILLVGSLNTLAFSTKTIHQDLDGLKALGLADELLAEISSLYYVDPEEPTMALGREPGEIEVIQRSDWDDVDDYHGLNESTLRFRDGTEMLNAAGWTRQTAVISVNPVTLVDSLDLSLPLRQVSMKLQSPSGRIFTYHYYISRDGFRTPIELAPYIRPVYESEWQVGHRNYYFGVPLRNMPDVFE